MPANSQLIYCARNLNATTYGMHTDWTSRVPKFTPKDNYDMIWVTAKMNGNPTNVLMFYCFDKPELFSVNVLKSNVAYNGCLATLSTPCNNICGAVYTWTAPNGTTLIGANQIIDTNIPGYVGNWTLTITFPNSFLPEGTCGREVFDIVSNISVSNCNSSNCISLPLIQ